MSLLLQNTVLAKTSPDKSIIDQFSFITDLSNTLSGALGLKSVILSQTLFFIQELLKAVARVHKKRKTTEIYYRIIDKYHK